jgi:hypothetical protein
MTLGRLARFSVLLLTLYVTADFMNGFMPGVFFFDDEDFFVDGAIEVSSNARYVASATAQLPVDDITAFAHDLAKVNDVDATPPLPRRSCTVRPWKNPRHKNAVAYPPSSSLDPLDPVLS